MDKIECAEMTLKELSHLYFKSYKLRVNRNSFTKAKYTYFRSFQGYGDILNKLINSINETDLIDFQEHLKKDTLIIQQHVCIIFL